MRSQIVVDKEFNILSRSIDNATTCKVTSVEEDCFVVELANEGKYEIDESVELFAMTDKGQLYFETIVKSVNGKTLSIWYPIVHKFLQRREYSRILTEKLINLKDETKDIEAIIIDISAGGIKVKTKQTLELLKRYDVCIDIENKKIECSFEPIRIETDGEIYTSSGRFVNLDSTDRISLVQYCFRKQIENSNK